MKKICLILFTAITVSAQAQYPVYSRGQSIVSYTDPASGGLQFKNSNNTSANADRLEVGKPVKLSLKLSNNSLQNAVPAGSCQLKITLGSKLKLNVNNMSQLTNLPLTNYIQWDLTSMSAFGQDIITGKLIQDLPAGFSADLDFTVLPSKEGASSVTCQLLITNDGGTLISDIAPSNNFGIADYNNIKAFGIQFLSFGSQVHGCAADVNWAISDKDHQTVNYYIETSEDGLNFTTERQIPATAETAYHFLLQDLSSKVIAVRIKAESSDGRFSYSEKASISNLCNGRFEIAVYPNPVSKESNNVMINARAGIFNGRYSIRLIDAAGKEIKRTEINTNNQLQVRFFTGVISSGNYVITVTGNDGKPESIPFIKL